MSHYFATCPKGMEYLLRDELVAIGASDVREALAGVQAFAAKRRLPLLVLDDDHRLGSSMELIATQFRAMLERLASAA